MVFVAVGMLLNVIGLTVLLGTIPGIILSFSGFLFCIAGLVSVW